MIPQENMSHYMRVQEIRFKRYQINFLLMAYIRYCYRSAWEKGTLDKSLDYSQVFLTTIYDVDFEKKCLLGY